MLRIIQDETSCKLPYDQKRGIAVCRQRALSRAKKTEIVQDVSRGKLRGCFTLIAMICDDASLQPLLPQILLGNEHIFQQRVLAEIQPSLAPNIHLWRRHSAWATRHRVCPDNRYSTWGHGYGNAPQDLPAQPRNHARPPHR